MLVANLVGGGDMVVFSCAVLACLVPDFVDIDVVMVGERW
jgi:hypothetical protein